jgi:hypothetical protein
MKTSILKLNLLIALVILGFCMGYSQSKTTTPPQAAEAKKPMPRPSPFNPKSKFAPQVQYLMKFSGKWSADAAFTADGKTNTVKYQVIGRAVAEGEGLLVEESFNDSVMGKMRGVNLAAYDSLDGKIHWYSMSNQYAPHEHSGTWLSPDSLYLEHKSVRKGKSYSEKINFAFKGRDEMNLSFVASIDGKESEKVVAKFTRDLPPNAKKPEAPGTEKEKKE